ncbi:polyprenyl synthetase family protein [Prosthecochloris sp. SCSIO W1101]|uniref:polyprenyl synthetase family protein n=1 Tax=Prosthecochloris sp. SCSIO W1101 TaxID=2992242 RepID=UPI00223DE252|nr:polyprenyl synthetase family protein [Prosthecochloris sp. SCSIO W1101]UZJ41071.1 polyprenyl synthetase family protein [Prosthecochloris sp. SCSIO W1101]
MNISITLEQVEQKYQKYYKRLNNALSTCFTKTSPETLYPPAQYILEGKGKRIRPFLTLLACEAVSGFSKNAINTAIAIEILHNSTLAHDDIMDQADLRHGRPTIHVKWNTNAAILSGDMMIAFAYEYILQTNTPRHDELVHLLNEAHITICEGQAIDMEFEQRKDATITDYLDMISKKTGRLISASLEAGGIVGDGTSEQLEKLVIFGNKIGRAFQVQDDYLDIMAEDGKSGKVSGGDVINGKKTYLLLRSLDLATDSEKNLLQSIIDNNGISPERVPEIRGIYERCGVLDEARELINADTEAALSAVETLPYDEGREYLKGFALKLMKRDF